MKRANLLRIMISIVGVLFLAFISIGCSSARMESKKNQEVVLTTGSQGDEVVWHIRNVKSIDSYIPDKGNVKRGDAISIEGESISKSYNTPFFPGNIGVKTKPVFILEDTRGNPFVLQAKTAQGEKQDVNGEVDGFTLVFSLTDDGSINPSINSWSDLVIADPDDKYRDLPGHKVSLGAFDVNADS